MTTTFGGGTLDLSGATLADRCATLRLKALFGGGQLIVPDDWRVESRLAPVLEGVGDGRTARVRPDDAPVLTLTGLALFGGWGVTGPVTWAAGRARLRRRARPSIVGWGHPGRLDEARGCG